MKGLRDEARGTSTTDMNGDDRRPRRFTLAELWAAPSRCARQGSATSSTRRAQLLRTRMDAGTVDRPKSQVESCSLAGTWFCLTAESSACPHWPTHSSVVQRLESARASLILPSYMSLLRAGDRRRVRPRVHELVNILPTGANRQDARKERISSLLPEASLFGEMAAQQQARASFARQLSWGMRTCGSVYYNNKRDVKRVVSA